MRYESTVVVESKISPGVKYTIARMSFGRRLELGRRIRKLTETLEFLNADDDPRGKMDAGLLNCEVERIYLLWGLLGIDGLEFDEAAATPETLAEVGPEDLFREALEAVKAECGLSDAERKN